MNIQKGLKVRSAHKKVQAENRLMLCFFFGTLNNIFLFREMRLNEKKLSGIEPGNFDAETALTNSKQRS